MGMSSVSSSSSAAQGLLSLGVNQPSAAQQALLAPNIKLVSVAPQPTDQSPTKPKKSVPSFTAPRDPMVGGSLLLSGPLSDAAGGLFGQARDTAASQGSRGVESLPTSQGLIGVYPDSNGGAAYLTAERWHQHIRQGHIINPPTARGKRTTTWWPVYHTANGAQSKKGVQVPQTMSEQDVLNVIRDAAQKGIWQKAPRGTLLSVYELPTEQAERFGLSEVKISAAPDGKILSAYPSKGKNVLAVRELTAEEQSAADSSSFVQPDEQRFTSRVPDTGFDR